MYRKFHQIVWKFSQLPKDYFETLSNQRNFLQGVGKVLNIKKWTDWYQYSSTDIEEVGGKYNFAFSKHLN